MRLLILDFIRRQKHLYKIGAVFLIGFSFMGISAESMFQAIVLMIGAMYLFALNSREIHQLPVSRKEIWRARWALVCFPVALSLAIRLALFGIAAAIGRNLGGSISWILLSNCFPLIYLGAMFAVTIPITKYMLPRLASLTPILLGSAAFGIAVVAGEAFLAERLPKRLEEWGGGTILMLAVGVCLTAMAFFHEPKIAPRLVIRLSPASSPRIDGAGPKAAQRSTGLTGLPFLFWVQIRMLLVFGISCGIAAQLPIVIAGQLEFQSASRLEQVTFFLGRVPVGAAIFLLTPIFFASLTIFMASDLLGLRHLRSLPLANRSLAAILTLIPMVFWVIFWVFPVAAHWMVFKQLPSTFRLDLLALLIGLTCLAGSATMLCSVKGPLQFLALPFLTFAGFSVLHFLGQLSMAATLLTGFLGLSGVVVSFVLYERALQRNSAVYKSKIPLHPGVRPRWIV